MGKKATKKIMAHPPKDKKASILNPTVDDAVSVVTVKKPCHHIQKVSNLSAPSAKLGSIASIRCEDCREGVRGNNGSGKHGKKKKKEKEECGHYGCDGVSRSRAVRHAKLTLHPVAIQFERPSLRWCVPCSVLVKLEDSTGEVITGGGGGYHAVKGFVNLGNTCFFNSVMQNLLSMVKLQDALFKPNASFGPLTVSLKKLFVKVKGEEGKKAAINPRCFFNGVCSKAPQFRGYQQHDSHELLRCLLDVLSTEEIKVRKKSSKGEVNALTSEQSVTVVDSIFGGEISSCVCCVKCGHSSTIYEPFLDLSLPVPTKKPPLKRKGNRSRRKGDHLNQDSSSSSNNPCNEEPLEFESSEAILLPYQEDGDQVSSNSINDSSELVDDSDPGEVDDSDCPVSVKRCLADFTRPELLSNENAWHCEECSKTAQNKKSRRKQVEAPVMEASGSGDTSNNSCTENDIDELNSSASCLPKALLKGVVVDEDDDDDDEIDTPTVKVKRNATKRTLISKAPTMMTIHLNRFRQDSAGLLNKLSGHVTFQELLDLSPYMVSTRDEVRCIYRLLGVVEHLGSMGGGHYVAYVKGSSSSSSSSEAASIWYYASDEDVEEVSLDEVLKSEAYILFYEMISLDEQGRVTSLSG